MLLRRPAHQREEQARKIAHEGRPCRKDDAVCGRHQCETTCVDVNCHFTVFMLQCGPSSAMSPEPVLEAGHGLWTWKWWEEKGKMHGLLGEVRARDML